jgi:hypothetical protein
MTTPADPPPASPPPEPAPRGARPPGRTPLAICAFIFASAALFTFVYLLLARRSKDNIGVVLLMIALGTVALILGIIAVARKSKRRGDFAIGILAIVFGALGSCLGCPAALFKVSSCPRIYAFDGQSYRLDADLLASALFAGGEAEDVDRLEHAAPVDGEYRLRLKNELAETDHLDSVSLLVADHPARTEVLPTPAGELLALSALASPRTARDGRGRDVLPLLAAADGRTFTGRASDFDPDALDPPTERLTIRFRPAPAAQTALVLRGQSSHFASVALARYLAEIGPGLEPLLRLAQRGREYPYARRLRDEIERLGLSLQIDVQRGDRWERVATLRPVGPAVLRSQAVPLPRGSTDEITLRLSFSPLLWRIDQLQLASAAAPAPHRLLSLGSARRSSGGSETAILVASDGQRLRLEQGEAVELRFAVPPGPPLGQQRTLLVRARGFYEPQISGGGLALNPVALYRHRAGRISLPRYALRLAHRDPAALE